MALATASVPGLLPEEAIMGSPGWTTFAGRYCALAVPAKQPIIAIGSRSLNASLVCIGTWGVSLSWMRNRCFVGGPFDLLFGLLMSVQSDNATLHDYCVRDLGYSSGFVSL